MRNIDLAGEWTLAQWEDGETIANTTVPMQIPGDTFSALIATGKIPDPSFGINELDCLWVGQMDWLLSRSISIEPEFLESRNVFLHIDSLDTVAEIRINGTAAAHSSNINDVWPVASWSSIEYSGKWKLLHYAARKFYVPVHVAAFCADGMNVEIVGVNDTPERCKGTLRVQFIDFAGKVQLEKSIRADLDPEAASPLASCSLDELPGRREEIVLVLYFAPMGDNSSIAAPIANELFFCPPKCCALEKPEIKRDVRIEAGRIAVELQTDVPAFFVSLDVEGLTGFFEDNLFTLLPAKTKTVRFSPRDGMSTDEVLEILNDRLKLFHLRGTYR